MSQYCPQCGEGDLSNEGVCSNPLCDWGPLIASDELRDSIRHALEIERELEGHVALDDEVEE